jgi:ubiquinone biosynthesis protein
LAANAPDNSRGGIVLDLGRLLLLLVTAASLPFSLGLSVAMGRRPTAQMFGARLRAALQRLGLTYVKLGQFMAMRFDILPEAICHELAQLFDDVAPVPTAALKRALEQEFRAPVERVFRSFEWEPMAAASVAQVHRATLASGQAVAVKVQRPGVARIFAADMRNLVRLARLVDWLGLLGAQSIRDAVLEFERFTSRELDFMTEGRTAERLRGNAGPHEYAPRIFWEHTTSRVLTMELISGHRLSDLIAAQGDEPPPIELPDLDRAARNLARACLRQLFVTGFFHADPHPGNIFVLDDGSICFVDFGIFGQLSPARRETFAAYIEDVAMGNLASAYRHFMRLLIPTRETDHRRLRADIEAIFRRWRAASLDPDTPLSERHLGKYVGEFIATIRVHKVRMSLDTLLFWRTLIVLDATALRFRHSFDLLDIMRQFFAEMRPGLVERILAALQDRSAVLAGLQLCHDMPGRLEQALATEPGRQVLVSNEDVAGDHRPGARTVGLGVAALGLGLALAASGLDVTGWLAAGAIGLATVLLLAPLMRRRGDA